MKNLPKLLIQIENGKKKTEEEKKKDGLFNLYAVIFVVIVAVVFLVGYVLTNEGVKEARCERYAMDKAREKIKTGLSELVTITSPTPEELETTEEYKRMLEKNAVYTKDKDYYYNQCMYK
jgi:hypothetical protein